MKKIAVYAGSFDPFTNGHMNIVGEAVELFDEVYVALASNSNKNRTTDINKMREAIIKCVEERGIENCHVEICDGLIADFCKEKNAEYLIRGLRNTSDYLYEENIAKINNEINPGLKTIYFRAYNEVISSSMVRELKKHGKDISKYIPNEIALIL